MMDDPWTAEDKERIGRKGAEDLQGTCSGVYEVCYCPEGVELEDFIAWVEEFGEVSQCSKCGWYEETSEFDEEGMCQDCQELNQDE